MRKDYNIDDYPALKELSKLHKGERYITLFNRFLDEPKTMEMVRSPKIRYRHLHALFDNGLIRFAYKDICKVTGNISSFYCVSTDVDKRNTIEYKVANYLSLPRTIKEISQEFNIGLSGTTNLIKYLKPRKNLIKGSRRKCHVSGHTAQTYQIINDKVGRAGR